MRTAESLSRDEWERILHAPFHAYMHVGGVEGPPIEAQFRFLTEEFAAGRDTFSDGSVGAMMTAALTENPKWSNVRLENSVNNVRPSRPENAM